MWHFLSVGTIGIEPQQEDLDCMMYTVDFKRKEEVRKAMHGNKNFIPVRLERARILKG